MAEKTFKLQVASKNEYRKILKGDKSLSDEEETVSESWTYVGPYGGWGKNISYSINDLGYNFSRYWRIWEEWAHVKFAGNLVLPEPKEANKVRYMISLEDLYYGEEAVAIKVLGQVLPDDYEMKYRVARTYGNIFEGRLDGKREIELTKEQAQSAIKYGIAVMLPEEMTFEDIKDYGDIDVDGEWDYETDGSIRAYIDYSVENLASRGVASDFYPVEQSIILKNNDNVISWTYNQEFEAPQYYVTISMTDLEKGGTMVLAERVVIQTESGGTASYTIPAGTLWGGRKRFTISVLPEQSINYYETNDIVWYTGETVEYTVKEVAETGKITANGKPVLKVSWESGSQAIYQVRTDDYDSGAIAGSEREYTIPRIWEDGYHNVSVRTATKTGEWSEWSEQYVNVKNVRPNGTLSLRAERFGQNVRLVISFDHVFEKIAIYRDGKMIAVVTDNSYVDRFTSGKAKYMARGISDGYYTESDIVEYDLDLSADLISVDGGYTYKTMKYTLDPKEQTDSFVEGVEYQYYAGRSKPIAIYTGATERSKRFSYVFKDRGDALAIRDMKGAPVLIKTTRGCVLYGVMESVNVAEGRRTILTFTVREIWRDGESVDYVP